MMCTRVLLAFACVAALAGPASAESQQKPAAPAPTPAAPATGTQKPAAPSAPRATTVKPELPKGVETPPDYVIGPEDVLSVLFWRDKDLSADVSVRPDGQISLLLVNDIKAAGLTVEQLRKNIEAAAAKFVEEPTVSVIVKAINSRKVSITGYVAKIGSYPLLSSMTLLQLIANAGGLGEYAKRDAIRIVRTDEAGKITNMKFNYDDVLDGRAIDIDLKPGDRVIVP
jgi:polysaccharide biosynthesis/export protein